MANSNYNSLTLIKSLGFIYVFMSSWKNKAVHIMWDKVSTTTMLNNYDDRIIESICFTGICRKCRFTLYDEMKSLGAIENMVRM